MTQLILDTGGYHLLLPESRNGGYSAQIIPLSVDVEMISGRIVRELRGNVWIISYQYGYFDDQIKNKVIAACEKGQSRPINCGFLQQESKGELSYSDFFVTAFSRPKFMWSRQMPNEDGVFIPIPLWADFSVELREVRPHD